MSYNQCYFGQRNSNYAVKDGTRIYGDLIDKNIAETRARKFFDEKSGVFHNLIPALKYAISGTGNPYFTRIWLCHGTIYSNPDKKSGAKDSYFWVEKWTAGINNTPGITSRPTAKIRGWDTLDVRDNVIYKKNCMVGKIDV